MTKSKQKHLAASLEAVIEGLNNVLTPINSKDRVYIICEQIKALRGIVGDVEESAVTVNEYHRTQADLPNGKLYSAVFRTENGEAVEVYDNCAEVIKGGVANG